MTVLQNVTDSIQNATTVLLQNATQVYYKMRQFFVTNVTVLLLNATVITKCDVYYKIATVHTLALITSTLNTYTLIDTLHIN